MGYAILLSLCLSVLNSYFQQGFSYTIDSVHSSVLFRIKHVGVAYVYGRFNQIQGSVVFDPDRPEATRLEVTIPLESVDTNNEKRDAHLRGPDFFDGKRFPEIRFVSQSVNKVAEGTYEATGNLTLHGVTKPVTITLHHTGTRKLQGPVGGTRTGLHAVATIKRSDFGMTFMLDMLSDEVTVIVSIECVLQE
jgi:polyisoprenoid-binding protein YceI